MYLSVCMRRMDRELDHSFVSACMGQAVGWCYKVCGTIDNRYNMCVCVCICICVCVYIYMHIDVYIAVGWCHDACIYEYTCVYIYT